jgi:UDP-xylose/UDP-N-acetylglucosamine transporter B4|uniref:UDP-xylose and UDP-N-acetylglucosamine transporter n=2 Tax=Panagrolaimus TaxID=55784 RepID=A0A914Q5D2_9BILA
MSAAFSIFGTLTGCIGSMTCVESLAKEQPGAMNLLTFSTFLFITLEGLFLTTKFLTVPNKIPIKGYLPVCAIAFFGNVINNQALNFHVPVPLHIIFRSGALLTNLIMNKYLQGKQYSTQKYASVLLITVGIIVCTLASANVEKKEAAISLEDAQKHYQEWVIGIAMLIIALLATSYLAIVQQNMYEKYGKHPREAMFYIHAMSLPIFALMGSDIYNYIIKFTYSHSYSFLGIDTGLPHLWVKLFGACIGQWLCILFVYRLNSEVDSLTVTLVVTLRKFLSLLISIFWFGNVFTMQHWIGAALVFGGTLAFSKSETSVKAKKH